MKRIALLIVVTFLIYSCETTTKKEGIQDSLTTPRSIEKEPTLPEETEAWGPKPARVVPGNDNAPPSDAIVLFNGSNFEEWESLEDGTSAKWQLNKDGSMTIIPDNGGIQTKKEFGSIQLHLEWKSPSDIQGDGQNRGNSGIYLQKRYEVQVLDNNDNETYTNGQVGSIYKQSIPLVMASTATGEWNAYDIIFHAPEFNTDGNKTKSGTITVLHNGILVQDHVEIRGTTEHIGWPKNIAHGNASIVLQDHGCAVSYRNIWVRKLYYFI